MQTKVAAITTTFSSSLGFDFKVGRDIFCHHSLPRWCGMAWQFQTEDETKSERKFVQMPSHHCTIWKSGMAQGATPVCDRPTGEAQEPSDTQTSPTAANIQANSRTQRFIMKRDELSSTMEARNPAAGWTSLNYPSSPFPSPFTRQGNIALTASPCTNNNLILMRRLSLCVSARHLIDGWKSTNIVGSGAPKRLDTQRREFEPTASHVTRKSSWKHGSGYTLSDTGSPGVSENIRV